MVTIGLERVLISAYSIDVVHRKNTNKTTHVLQAIAAMLIHATFFL
jgi:hypothetical protein